MANDKKVWKKEHIEKMMKDILTPVLFNRDLAFRETDYLSFKAQAETRLNKLIPVQTEYLATFDPQKALGIPIAGIEDDNAITDEIIITIASDPVQIEDGTEEEITVSYDSDKEGQTWNRIINDVLEFATENQGITWDYTDDVDTTKTYQTKTIDADTIGNFPGWTGGYDTICVYDNVPESDWAYSDSFVTDGTGTKTWNGFTGESGTYNTRECIKVNSTDARLCTEAQGVDIAVYTDELLKEEGKPRTFYMQFILPPYFNVAYDSNGVGYIKPVGVISTPDTRLLIPELEIGVCTTSSSVNCIYVKIPESYMTQYMVDGLGGTMNARINTTATINNMSMDIGTIEDFGNATTVFKTIFTNGSTPYFDGIENADKVIRSKSGDTKFIEVVTQDDFDNLRLNSQTSSDTLYHVIEEYEEDPTIPPEQDPVPNRALLSVKYGDSIIWSNDYTQYDTVTASDINLEKITGYSFNGFYTDETLNTPATFPLTMSASLTLFAKYTVVKEYKCTLYIPNDSGGYDSTITYLYSGNTWNPTIPTKENYSITTYNNADLASGNEITLPVTITDDTNVYVKYTEVEKTYSFVMNQSLVAKFDTFVAFNYTTDIPASRLQFEPTNIAASAFSQLDETGFTLASSSGWAGGSGNPIYVAVYALNRGGAKIKIADISIWGSVVYVVATVINKSINMWATL